MSPTAVRKIPITRPYLGAEELAAVQKPLETGWLVQGPYVAEFEKRFAEFTGASAAVATTSCTTALHMAADALGVRPGDEVIVPAFTWVSTANIVESLGGRAVFCDIDVDTFNIDVSRIEGLLSSRTVGLLPVHLFGLAADMDPIMALARSRRLWVLEDAACAFGAWYRGRHAGTIGDAGCFSFHPRKSITTGEGGMVTTERADLDATLRSLRDHGASRSDLQRHTAKGGYLLADYDRLGYNYRMTDLQGALGCAQIDRASFILRARTEAAKRYDALLADVGWLARPTTPEGYVHGYQGYVTLFRPEAPTLGNYERLHERRNRIMSDLEERGIATRQGTHAPVTLGVYAKKYRIRAESFPNALFADRLTLALPLYVDLSADDQEYVVDELRKAYARSA
jgi:dTDP-4-amino-4,6-dideoxygalactose transaminase